MTKEQRDKLRDLALSATPGAWKPFNSGDVLALLDRVDELEGDAEPVAYAYWWPEAPEKKSLSWASDMATNDKAILSPLYRRPPTERAVPIALDGDEKGGRDWTFYAGGWNACREAMLAAAPGAGGDV